MKPDTHPAELSDADGMLEAFLAPARSPSAVPEALMSRILADAAAVSGVTLAPVIAAAPPERRGLLAALAAALGGWPVLGGMATATLAGVWIGFTSPALLNDTLLTDSSSALTELIPSFELAMADLDWSE